MNDAVLAATRPTRIKIGPSLALDGVMPTSGAELIGGLIFSSIGLIAFVYGKRMHVWKPMFIGLGLMAYPYFVSTDVLLYSLGAVLTAALFLFRD
ncbi:MAG: hypothetical protein M3Y69_09990 [Verrucomicrobiota bacterium]|nr:hypothetical protein [Verrucomicrobiota bacterium]